LPDSNTLPDPDANLDAAADEHEDAHADDDIHADARSLWRRLGDHSLHQARQPGALLG
jgi:hypothetical protein